MIRLLLSLAPVVEDIESGVDPTRDSHSVRSVHGGRDTRSSCSEAVSLTTLKARVIYGRRKRKRKRKLQSRISFS